MTAPSHRATLRSIAAAACRAVGIVVVVIAVDWAVGAAWEAATDSSSPTSTTPTSTTAVTAGDEGAPAPVSTPTTPTTDSAVAPAATPLPADQLDERIDSPALADAPWRAGYFSELAQLRYDYEPYLYTQAARNRGRYINTDDGVRRSYRPDVTREVPELWFFGGSAMWGEGQRDLHTIPSEVARIAEADGLPVRVVNRGERAWVIWQEALLFERVLAHEQAPDLAVFYDGANEMGVQFEHPYPEPTTADFDRWSRKLTGRALEPGQPHAAPDVDLGMLAAAADLWDHYRSTSALGRVVGNIGSIFATQPAGAQTGGSDTPALDERQTANAIDIYQRGRAMAQLIGREHDATTMFFWQPAFGTSAPYRQTDDRMAPGTIDLSGALDDVTEPVYLDPIHTNEVGARLVAEAMWEHLRPQVQDWYDAN